MPGQIRLGVVAAKAIVVTGSHHPREKTVRYFEGCAGWNYSNATSGDFTLKWQSRSQNRSVLAAAHENICLKKSWAVNLLLLLAEESREGKGRGWAAVSVIWLSTTDVGHLCSFWLWGECIYLRNYFLLSLNKFYFIVTSVSLFMERRRPKAGF